MLSILLQANASGQGFTSMFFLIAMIAVFYFFIIRPQSKKQKEAAKFRDALLAGDNVVTSGGLKGKVKEVNDKWVTLELNKDVVVTIMKEYVYPMPEEKK